MFRVGELNQQEGATRQRDAAVNQTLIDRAQAAYLGLAIGDALGSTVEFMTPNEIRDRYGVHRELCGGGWLHLKPGMVTDDTTMSLALGEALLSQKGKAVGTVIADAFDGWMRSKPVDIGNTVRRNLVLYRRTQNPVAPPSEHDAGNGAAMRLLPIALSYYGAPTIELIEASRCQAHVTHNNPLSDAACETLLEITLDFLSGHSLAAVVSERIKRLEAAFPIYDSHQKRRNNPSGFVVETLQAVFQALEESDSFESNLINVVNRGGDADTTGAIAGMLSGARYGLQGLPKRWLKALNPEIRTRCLAQAEALIRLSPGFIGG